MTSFCVGCDNIVGGESGLINRVAKVLESKGHTVERLSVGPNYVQSKGLSNSSKGKIAVFIVGGNDVGTYVDFLMGLKRGYYHYKYIWFAFASWTATTDKWITENGLKKTGLVRAHDDNFSRQSDIAPWLGKSADYFFQQNKTYMNYVWGKTPEELANKILGGGESSEEKQTSSSGTIKDALKQVLGFWDGDVECFIRDETVYVHKIPSPASAKIVIAEGLNVFYDSITLTDVNPTTVNKLTVIWGDTTYEFRDEDLIKRFGEVPGEVTLSDENITNETDARSAANTEWAKVKRSNGRSLECKVTGDTEFRVGQWVRAYFPSFKIDGYMYISKSSHDDSTDSGWNTNVTLVDYPPGFGEPPSEKKEEEKETTEETADETTDSAEDV